MRTDVIRLESKTKVAAAVEPKWNQLFVEGTFYRQDFPEGITLNKSVFEKMVENWKRAGSPELCVDFFHWGASNVTGVPVEDKVASGWIQRIRVKNGVLEGLIKWTDKARAKIQAEELKYFSPYFQMESHDRQTGALQGPVLLGGGLLNDPFLTNLPAVAASAAPQPTPETAKEKESKVNEKLKKAVCAAFGLPADATDEMLMSAASDLLAKNEDEKKKAAPEEMPPMVATQSATPAPVAASASTTAPSEISMAVEPVRVALAAAVAQTKELGEKIEKLEAEKLLAKTEALSEKLLSQGRLLPANKDAVVKMAKSLGLEEAEKFFMALPTVVDMSTRGVQAASEGSAREKFDAVVSELAKKHDIPRSAARELAIQSHKQLAMAAFNLKEN